MYTVPCLLISQVLYNYDEDKPSELFSLRLSEKIVFRIQPLSEKDKTCWDGPIPVGICKSLYPLYGFTCADDFCAIMIPNGDFPDTKYTGLCKSQLSPAPHGFIVDEEYGTCKPKPLFTSKNFKIFMVMVIPVLVWLKMSWIIGTRVLP